MDTYRLWKDNHIDQEFTVGREELQQRFTEWLREKGAAHIEYYSGEMLIRHFLTSKDGMSSTFEETDFPALYEDLGSRPVFVLEYLNAAKA